MLPNSALHEESLLVVYAVLWGAATQSFGRLRVFAIQTMDARAWKRFAWGVFLGNIVPVVLLAFLMQLPRVEGFWGVVAGGTIGLYPVAFPRLLHAFTASNESLPKHHSQSEAEQVLSQWDPQWFKDTFGTNGTLFKVYWDRLDCFPKAAANSRSSHILATLLVLILPLVATRCVLHLTWLANALAR